MVLIIAWTAKEMSDIVLWGCPVVSIVPFTVFSKGREKVWFYSWWEPGAVTVFYGRYLGGYR